MVNRIHVLSNWRFCWQGYEKIDWDNWNATVSISEYQSKALGNTYSNIYRYIDIPNNQPASIYNALSYYHPSTGENNSRIWRGHLGNVLGVVTLPNGNVGVPPMLLCNPVDLSFYDNPAAVNYPIVEYDFSSHIETNKKYIDSGCKSGYWNYHPITGQPTWFQRNLNGSTPLIHQQYGTVQTPTIDAFLLSFTATLEINISEDRYYQEPVLSDYYNGYQLDLEPFLCKVKLDFTPDLTQQIDLGYYQYANETQIDPDGQECKTYAYTHQTLNLVEGENFTKELEFVPCSLTSEDNSIFSLLQNNGNFFGKDWASVDKLPDLRARWLSLLNNKIVQDNPQGDLTIVQGTNHRISANNNIWNNGTIEPDINPAIGSVPSTQWIHTKYLEPHIDNNWGTYTMPDSPAFLDAKVKIEYIFRALQGDTYGVEELPPDGQRIPELIGNSDGDVQGKIEEIHRAMNSDVYGAEDAEINLAKLIEQVHKCLEADKYALNPDGDNPVNVSLAKYLTRASAILGYRPEPNGKFSIEKEKGRTRQILEEKATVDPQKSGGNYFGDEAMLVRRLPNRSVGGKLVNGGVAKVHDLPQLLIEILDQLNLALGLQESANLEIDVNGNRVKYPNQLALLTDLAVGVAKAIEFSERAMCSSLVSQQQTSEIIAGIGLPTVSKSIPVKRGKGTVTLPYWAIAPSHSLAKSIDTVGYNVGIVTGQLL